MMPAGHHSGALSCASPGDSPGSEKHASLENTLVRFKPDTKKCHNMFCQFMNTVGPTCFMIKIKCANDTIIELHDFHKSFVS